MEEKIEKAIKKLKKQRFLNKNRVIDELFKDTNNNSGILETSCVLSLKCPVSKTRIKTPIRFHYCKHAQCFDADSFFQLTLSSIIKKCPICNLQASYNSLIVDGLFYEILKNTSNSDEQVILYSNGDWEVKNENEKHYKNTTSNNDYKTKHYKDNDMNNYSNKNYYSNNYNYLSNYSRNKESQNNIINNHNDYNNVPLSHKYNDDVISHYPSEDFNNNNNYIENTKKKFLDDLSSLRYGLEQTSLHNDIINDINKQSSKNTNIDNQIKHNDIENYHHIFESEYKNDMDDIEEKMRTIQEIRKTINKILNMSINDSEIFDEKNNKEHRSIIDNDENEIKYDNNNNKSLDNYDNNRRSKSSQEFLNKINTIERKSEYISSKYKNELRKALSTDINNSKVIQLKAEKIKDHDKSKIVYYYSII